MYFFSIFCLVACVSQVAYGGPIPRENESGSLANVHRRSKKDHANAEHAVTLYHGTTVTYGNAIKAEGIKWKKGKAGEFTDEDFSGFYMTDKEAEAIAYACEYVEKENNQIGVVSIQWTPFPGVKIKELDDTPADMKIIEDLGMQNIGVPTGVGFKPGDFDMITGPHIGPRGKPHLAKLDWWQYAVTREGGLKGLKVVGSTAHACPKK